MPNRARAKRSSCVQFAALPWRRSSCGLEVLIITSRRTRRWIVPKGWPLANLSPAESAAAEALEEAGVKGRMGTQPIGSFSYDKILRSGKAKRCRVKVFSLEVKIQRRKWPEKKRRETRWCDMQLAKDLVADRGLKRLLAKFAQRRVRR